jgi:hypothetical protein
VRSRARSGELVAVKANLAGRLSAVRTKKNGRLRADRSPPVCVDSCARNFPAPDGMCGRGERTVDRATAKSYLRAISGRTRAPNRSACGLAPVAQPTTGRRTAVGGRKAVSPSAGRPLAVRLGRGTEPIRRRRTGTRPARARGRRGPRGSSLRDQSGRDNHERKTIPCQPNGLLGRRPTAHDQPQRAGLGFRAGSWRPQIGDALKRRQLVTRTQRAIACPAFGTSWLAPNRVGRRRHGTPAKGAPQSRSVVR